MAQNPRTTFHRRNWYQNTGGETAGVTGQPPEERISPCSTHQILMLSLLSWGEYWPAPPLQSPENQRSLKEKRCVLVALPGSHFSVMEGPLIPYSLSLSCSTGLRTSNLHSLPPSLLSQTYHSPWPPANHPSGAPHPKLLPHLAPPSLLFALVLSRRALITGHKLFALKALTQLP